MLPDLQLCVGNSDHQSDQVTVYNGIMVVPSMLETQCELSASVCDLISITIRPAAMINKAAPAAQIEIEKAYTKTDSLKV